jgi:gliding motility-associatede transport system auxiliary component
MIRKLSHADRNALAVGGIVLAVIFFFALNLAAGGFLRSAQVDLTADRLFTISDGTKQVLASIDEPITLRYYRSEQLRDLGPTLASHAQRVEQMLDEYVRLSGGRIVVERYDPKPYSPEEDLAVADRIQGLQTGDGTQIYFGLAGSNSTDDTEAIGYFAPERAGFLEYDLTRLIYDLANPDKPQVAVIGDLPLFGDQSNGFRPWAVLQSLRQFFKIRLLNGEVSKIDDEIGVLLLAQPDTLDEKTLYAIDQFVMRGGRILAVVDPYAEIMQRAPGGAGGTGAIDTLAPLLTAWGVEIPKDKIVGDRVAATRVQARHNGRDVITDYVAWLGLGPDQLRHDDVVTGDLRALHLQTSGLIQPRDGATTKIAPLVTTSDQAMEIPKDELTVMPDPVTILANFKPSGETYTLAARVTGPVKSAFPDGPPASIEDKDLRAAFKAEAEAPLNLILIADADMLADDAWIQNGSLLGQNFLVPTASNGDLIVNAVDNLSGSEGLISLRGRGLQARPFKVLENMRREAEDRYRATEQTLLTKIDETKAKIKKLQTEEQEGGRLLTGEQQATIEDFRNEMLALRQKLRDVQFALRKDTESLQTRITALNIWVVPIVVGLLAVVMALIRRWRARRYRASVAH